ncbi:hypothetical protein MANES_09G109200v8 [Manihot esculenta]|uniref:Uncharacterized protein n=1 Tax=Manihot esculenta TaxID=3983 RepID=A0A2C9V9W3_MANES|nr:hypothetical protein MANES_09G109200v8 [Manihot esculenta]
MANNNAGAQLSDSLAPNNNPQNDELLFSGDRNFAIHGEIMLLVLVLLFASFLLFIVCFLCKSKSNDSSKLSQSELVSPVNPSAGSTFKVQFKDGTNMMQVPQLPQQQ